MNGLPVERLREYLRQLPPGARALLVAELERAATRGDDVPGGAALLEEVRNAAREPAPAAARPADPAALFFTPVEPFLVDDDPSYKHQGRIARAARDPIWLWVTRDLMPEEAARYCEEATGALAADDAASSQRLAGGFQDVVVTNVRSALATAETDDRARRRLIGQIGTPKALEDIRDLATILSAREAFTLIDNRLPPHVRNLADWQLESVKVLIDSSPISSRELLPYTLALVMNHLAAPWQVVRLAVKATESDDATRIAASPYAVAVTMVLADTERKAAALKADLRRGATGAVTSLLKSIHDAARGLRTELDLSGDSPWARQLAAIRADVSDVLKGEVEQASGRVRRLLRPRPAGEIAPDSMLDGGDVAETEALIELVGACRHYASELAINEMALRTYGELQQYLDTGTRALLDSLRHAGDADRRFRQSQIDAAVRFCGKVFGQEYASLLTKAAEVAANAASAGSERKAAAKI